jgi:hypothetical protein
MVGRGGNEGCLLAFKLDPDTIKVGDTVSYRVTGSRADFLFSGCA